MTATVSHTNHTKIGMNNSTNSNSATPNIASQDVGLLFVREYYTFLNKKPFRLHAFYNKDSLFVRGDEGETVQTYQGQEEIRQKIEELNFEDCKVLVSQVDSQISANGGIIIQVLGEMCVMDGPSQKFSQTFFLAPQPNGYYVLNDIFRFLKDEVDIDYYTCEDDQQQQSLPKKDESVVEQQQPDEIPINEQQTSSPTLPTTIVSVQQQVEETVVPVVEKSANHATVVEPKTEEKKRKPTKDDTTNKTTLTNGAATENGKKNDKSKQQPVNRVAEKAAISSSPSAPATAAPATPAPGVPRSWATMAANDSSKWGTQASESKGSIPANASSTTQQPQPQSTVKGTAAQQTATQSQPPQVNKEQPCKDEVTNIFVKNVNASLNEVRLSEAFSKFGTVKSLNIVHGRGCAFLDFTTPEACQKALAQHKVQVGTSVVLAEERRRMGGNMNRQQQQQQQNGNYEHRHQNNYRRGGGHNNNNNNNNAAAGGGGRNNNNNNNNPGNAKSRSTGNPQK